MLVKNALSNGGIIYALDHNESFSPVTSTKHLRSCNSKRINKNIDNNKLFGLVNLTKRLCSYENKYVSKDNKNSDSQNQIATAPPAVFIERLTKCKTAYAKVYSNLSEKTEIITSATIIQ